MSGEERMRGARGDWQLYKHLGASRGPLSSWSIVPADLSLVLRLLHIFDKQSLFCIYFSTSLGETPFGKGLFLQKLKPQAEFPLIISTSITGAISLRAMGKIQASVKIESEEVAFHSITYSYVRYFFKYISSPLKWLYSYFRLMLWKLVR